MTENKICISAKIKPTLHVIGLPHTIKSHEYSHCAFTGKVMRFSSMMIPLGWKVVEYSNEGSESGASLHIQVLSKAELKHYSLRKSESEQYGADVNTTVLTELFYTRLGQLLRENVVKHDIVCHVFGPIFSIIKFAPDAFHVESGIGYTAHEGLHYRIFESAYWKGWHSGRNHNVNGKNYHWVCPNSYTLEEWQFNPTPKDYVLFFGRLNEDKGLRVFLDCAEQLTDTRFIICGQGDHIAWIDEKKRPNVSYLPPVLGLNRSELLGNASVVVTPSVFIEPFCGVAVEAQLCGTPVVSTSYGAFHETIEQGVTGYRCHTASDFINAIVHAKFLDRKFISDRARSLYDKHVVAKTYDMIFKTIADLSEDGYYSPVSHMFENSPHSILFDNKNNSSDTE